MMAEVIMGLAGRCNLDLTSKPKYENEAFSGKTKSWEKIIFYVERLKKLKKAPEASRV